MRPVRVALFRITVSSLNRHASGTWADVGISKVQSVSKFISSFAPFCKVEPVEELFHKESADRLICGGFGGRQPDYVVDCIDNVPTKVDLLEFCAVNKIPVMSACGSACKADPTRIKISLLEQSDEDVLARAVRAKLRQRGVDGEEYSPSVSFLILMTGQA